MGDRRTQALRVQSDGRLKLRFHGAKITSDAGLLAFRELDEAFRLTENAVAVLSDQRHGKNTQHTLLAMLREKLIKIGAKVVTHSRYVIFQMAEVAVPRELFAAILDRIQRFGVPPPLVRYG